MEVNRKLIDSLEENLLICGTYIHAITSTYYNDTIFDELEPDILKFSEKNTLFCSSEISTPLWGI